MGSSGHSSRWSPFRGHTLVSMRHVMEKCWPRSTCSSGSVYLLRSPYLLELMSAFQCQLTAVISQLHLCISKFSAPGLSIIYSFLIGSSMWYISIILQIDNKKVGPVDSGSIHKNLKIWFWVLKVSRSHLECNVVVFFLTKMCIINHILPLYECSISMLLNIWNYEPHALHLKAMFLNVNI